MNSKETTPIAGRATRWWTAPVRFPASTLALLRRATARRELPHDSPWVHQTPNGIRA